MGLKFSYLDTELTSSTCDSLLALGRSGKTNGDAYGLLIDVSNVLEGAGVTGPRSWGVGIVGSKVAGVLTTAGCDDALLKIAGENYVANAEIFNFRGINILARNRNGGVLGRLDNTISVATKTGSIQSTVVALSLDNEHMSADTPDEIGGLDIALCREGGAATKEYALKLRTRGTINTAIETAILIEKGTDLGFSSLFKTDAIATIGMTTAASVTVSHKIAFKVGSVTYYIPCGTTTS